ncbi:hypothetical protein G6F50_017058 [Rhizopus delemar]|uniref:Uncharacterized protein n=1 Tax=Rhizopus delemar TaxID=936053 RepID=A0A9P6XS42_9FUNG|nr:hypothetical protein G6F50_017058 [Rhizopus delemar]
MKTAIATMEIHDPHGGALQRGERQRPRGADGKGIAGQLVGAARGEAQEFAGQDVKGDQQHAGPRQSAAGPYGRARKALGAPQQAAKQAEVFGLGHEWNLCGQRP